MDTKKLNMDVFVDKMTQEMKILLSHLTTYGDSIENKPLVLDVLKAIINFCSNKSFAKDIFRTSGGLSLMTDFVCSTSDSEYLEGGLKVLSCAVDQNNFNQMEMTKKDIFILLCGTLEREDVSPSLVKRALLLISTLLYQNGIAQNMFGELNCLQCCINLYQEIFPSFMLGHVSVKNNNKKELVSTELWQAVNTVLCFSMTNPVNESNQEKCSKLLPIALKLLQCCSYSEIVSSVTSFLSSLIVDSEKNRCLLIEHDGLVVLEHCLEVGVMSIIANRHSNVSIGDVQATVNVISLIDLCISGNETSAAFFSKSNMVSLMARLLFVCSFLDNSSKTKILLALGHFIEVSSENIKFILSEGNLKAFFQQNSSSSSDDVLKACQYVIHLMLMYGDFMPKEMSDTFPVQLQETKWQSKFSENGDSCVTEMHERLQKLQRTSTSFSSIQSHCESNHTESQLKLNKIKEERVKEYLQQLPIFNQWKTNSTSSNQNFCRTNSEVSLKQRLKAKKVKYFTKKLGTRLSLANSLNSSIIKKPKLDDTIDLITETNGNGTDIGNLPKQSSKECCCTKTVPCHNTNKRSFKNSISKCGLFKVPASAVVPTSTPKVHNPCSIFDKLPNRSMIFGASSEISEDSLFINSRRKQFMTSSFVTPKLTRKNVTKDQEGSTRNKVSSSILIVGASQQDASIDVLNSTLHSKPANVKLASTVQKQKKNINFGADSSLFESENAEPYFDVLVFPPKRCEKHGLICSTERVWYSPKDDNF